MKKRLLSMLMALALCLTLLPAPAWAAEADAPEGGTIVQEEQQEKAPAAESSAILEQAAENGIAAQNGGDSTVENAVAEVTSGGTTYYYTDLSAALAKVNTDGGAQEQCSCITLCTEGNTGALLLCAAVRVDLGEGGGEVGVVVGRAAAGDLRHCVFHGAVPAVLSGNSIFRRLFQYGGRFRSRSFLLLLLLHDGAALRRVRFRRPCGGGQQRQAQRQRHEHTQ